MPISKIKGNAINDGAITLEKTDSLFVNTEITGTEAARMPNGTTAQRASAQSGDIRFNSTLSLMEYYDGNNWKSIDAPPAITSIVYPGDDNAADIAGGQTITINGNNFSTVGTIIAEFDGSASPTVTSISNTQITAVTPAHTADAVQLEIINPSGLSARTPFSYAATGPVWNTALDTVIATQTQGTALNITSVSAPESGGGSISYALKAGSSLPSGVSLNASTCAITGNLPSITANTIYTFTLVATDAESQTSERQFKITSLVNYFGDGSDGNLGT